jgi:pyrimidine operon attenuation protein / uracil phosphoribosyltransferase
MELMAHSTEVLNHKQVNDRIHRIAWQIFEEFHEESKVIIAGIANRGYLLAEILQAELIKISDLQVELSKLEFDKENPLSSKPILKPDFELDHQNIVLVDDVLKSGGTLIYGVRHFLSFPIRTLKTVVLVDRNHKRYPVKADFKGLSLSTSMQEHVSVHIEVEPYSVMLS